MNLSSPAELQPRNKQPSKQATSNKQPRNNTHRGHEEDHDQKPGPRSSPASRATTTGLLASCYHSAAALEETRKKTEDDIMATTKMAATFPRFGFWSAPSVVLWFLLVGRRSAAAFGVVGRNGNRHSPPLSRPLRMSKIENGDTVVVVGGTSGVGQLVTRKLTASGNGYNVRVASRDVERAKSSLGDGVDVAEVDLTGGIVEEQLGKALEGANAVVVSVGTTAFPTIKWRGGNTPTAIDRDAVRAVAKVASKLPSLKKIVMVTSVGVYRTSEMPFLVLNLFGVLDAKRDGEDAVKAASQQRGSNFDYVVVRPGRLVGGPFTNLDVAKLLQIEGGAFDGVDLELGDSGLGDCSRDACAEAVVRSLLSDDASNLDFSLISNPEKKALTPELWEGEFRRLKDRQG